MRNNSKITTLESKFPLLSIEQGCMVSKDADITVAFRVELPELFTVTSAEYEAMHSAWYKAVKVLPNYSIVHKQDWFIKEDYQGKLSDGGLSFLARASERHFNERPYLYHSVYLFLTKTNKQRMAQQSNFSALCRGHLIPKEITNQDEVMKFMEAVDQFERIINETEQIRITRLTEEELVGTAEHGGLPAALDAVLAAIRFGFRADPQAAARGVQALLGGGGRADPVRCLVEHGLGAGQLRLAEGLYDFYR